MVQSPFALKDLYAERSADVIVSEGAADLSALSGESCIGGAEGH